MGIFTRAHSLLVGGISGLALAVALGGTGPATGAGVPETNSGRPYTSKSARTRFVLTRKLSADRLGVLAMTPEEGEYVTANSIVAKLKDDVPQAQVASAGAKAESE